MTLPEKVRSVEEVFNSLDAEINLFQQASGLHCKAGCGKCCFKPDIEATVLEFLPFAYHLYKNKAAESFYDNLGHHESSLCVLLSQSSLTGMCGQYAHRGLICRLFGFSARTDKYGKRELVTCQIIKTEQSSEYKKAFSAVQSEAMPIPLMSRYHMLLVAIDDELARTHYPINLAIKKAIEIVLSYYAYREDAM